MAPFRTPGPCSSHVDFKTIGMPSGPPRSGHAVSSGVVIPVDLASPAAREARPSMSNGVPEVARRDCKVVSMMFLQLKDFD